MVVNEPELTQAMNLLRGEWGEASGGTLRATSRPWRDVAAAEGIDADLVVFPTRYLGELAMRGWLRPVRRNVLEGDVFAAADVYPLVRRELITWGGEVMALPLGIDLPSQADSSRLRPSVRLFVEAAPEAVAAERTGVLFDPETMTPRIADVPFVEALQRMTGNGANDQPVRRGSASVPVLGAGDRLVAVTSGSRNAASAFQLLAWLASAEIGTQLASAGEGMLSVRRPHASQPVGDGRHAAGRSRLDRALQPMLSGERFLMIPRIAGIDEYLDALDRAVESALSGSVEPREALVQAAARWEAITDSLGRETQREAYWKHLGLTGP